MDELPYQRLTQEQRDRIAAYPNIIHWIGGNVIIMFQGKCANTAIKAAILMAEGGIDSSINIHADPRLNYVTRDYTIQYRDTVPVLAVVRRPWDRLVSFWRDKIAGRDMDSFTCDYLPGSFGGMPFEDYVGLVLEAVGRPDTPAFLDNHLGPAHTYLAAGGTSIPREIIQFNDLVGGIGWQVFKRWTAKAWDLPDTLPHVNKPKVAKPVLSPETEDRLRQEVFAKYYIDYRLFKWEP